METPTQLPAQPLPEAMPIQGRQRSPGYAGFDLPEAPQDMRAHLSRQLGQQVTAYFVTGDGGIFQVQGVLRKTGRNFIVIEEAGGDSILCDLHQLRFLRMHTSL